MNVARSWTSNRVVVYAFSPFRWLQNVEPDYVHCKEESPGQLSSTSASYSEVPGSSCSPKTVYSDRDSSSTRGGGGWMSGAMRGVLTIGEAT